MKKILLIAVLVIAFPLSAWATNWGGDTYYDTDYNITNQGGQGGQGGDGGSAYVKQAQLQVFNPTVKTDVKIMNDVKVMNNVKSSSGAISGAKSDLKFSYTEAEQKLQPQYIPAYNAPILQQGKDGVYQELLPIAGIKVFDPKTEKIKNIIDTINGFPGWRTRLENLYPKLLDNRIEGAKIRYIVFFKDASTGGTIGTGVGSAASFGNADFGANANGGTGYSQATFNREYYILIVEVE